ncbi:hypothetical protein NDU88_002725 [Pleurodeles waltl]|uniref:Uncharacterized protein n=1 Tax=Pleurodeles waltl TaxID=8319 RepID=A0AAV7VDE3_PLEWA|nr:hypothetical protein NDU88_002725 [Pleurodeles waltl]
MQLAGLGPHSDQQLVTGPTLEGVARTWARCGAAGPVGYDRACLLAPNCLGPVSLSWLGTWLRGSEVRRRCMAGPTLVKTAWVLRGTLGPVGHNGARLLTPDCLGPVSLGLLGPRA